MILMLMIYMSSGNTNPVELGDVAWLRNMDEAVKKSKLENKPILILFQEVPGCQTCKNYGSQVLTHPLIVEAIESHFIPLAIFNNKGGHDAEILKRYHEPAWNNPVVRIVKASGEDVLPRLSGNYSAEGLTGMMVNALVQLKGKSPAYLQLLADELTARKKGTATAVYSMHCFWSGEALFGKVNGVIATTAGWQNGREVVKVEYDPSVLTKTQLDQIAKQGHCAISAGDKFSVDKTPKYYLSNHALRCVPMTELQKARVNSAIAEGQDAMYYLSERQIQISKNCE